MSEVATWSRSITLPCLSLEHRLRGLHTTNKPPASQQRYAAKESSCPSSHQPCVTLAASSKSKPYCGGDNPGRRRPQTERAGFARGPLSTCSASGGTPPLCRWVSTMRSGSQHSCANTVVGRLGSGADPGCWSGHGPWSSSRPPRKNQRPNSSIQQVRDAEPFRRTQRMNCAALQRRRPGPRRGHNKTTTGPRRGHDGSTTGPQKVHDGATKGPRKVHERSTKGPRKIHDGLKPNAIIAVSAFADTKSTSEGRSETGDPPSAGAVHPPRLVDVGP